MARTVFESIHSFEDAEFKARMQGYIPTGARFTNKKGYVIVANQGGWR